MGLGHQWEPFKPVDYMRPDWAALMLSARCVRDGCGLEKHMYFDWNGNRNGSPYYRKPPGYVGRGGHTIKELQFAFAKRYNRAQRRTKNAS
jgi:hypothetical protein